MRLLLEDARDFSKCPRFYSFLKSKNIVLPSRRVDAFKHAMQRCYGYQMGGFKPTWRKVMGWVDSQIFKDIDVTDDEAIEKGRKISESVLVPIRNWYENVFMDEHVEAFVNVPVEYTIKGHQFHTIVPILKLTDPVTAVIMDVVEVTRLQLYNDILARGTGLIVANQLNQESVRVEHLLLGPTRALESTTLDCDKELNKRTEKVLIQIADQVTDKVNYPSYTTMCNTCPFRKDCIL